MRNAFLLVIFSIYNYFPVLTTVIEIQFMTQCVTKHDAWIYNGYGCYCGIGGSGEILDEIDDCCAHHDRCYEALSLSKTCWDVPMEYFPFYSWTCNEGKIECTGLEALGGHFEPFTCSNNLCDCDKKLVECWSQFPMPKFQKKCHHPRIFYKNE